MQQLYLELKYKEKSIEERSDLLSRYAIKEVIQVGYHSKKYKLVDLAEPNRSLLVKFTKNKDILVEDINMIN